MVMTRSGGKRKRFSSSTTRGRFRNVRRRLFGSSSKRRFRRKRSYLKKRGIKPARTIGGFPIRQVVKFRVTDVFQFNTTANGALAVNISGTGASKNYIPVAADDPQAWDIYKFGTAAGYTAPVNWSKWASLYQQFRVLGSKCTLEIFDTFPVNTSGTGGSVPTPANGYTIGIVMDDGTATHLPSTNNALIEQNSRKVIKWRSIPPTLVNRTPKISLGYSPKKFWDVYDVASAPEGILNTQTTSFTPGAQTDIMCNYYPFVANQDNATSLTLNGRITIDYMVEFINLNLQQAIPT